MALVKATLQQSLVILFNAMKNDTSGDPSIFANGLASAVVAYVATGIVSTTDGGTVTGGTYAGAGTGTLTVTTACASQIITACNYMYSQKDNESFDGNAYFAEKLGEALASQAEGGTVSCTVTGTLTPPSGTPITPYPGVSTGSISVSSSSLVQSLKSTFSEMWNKREQEGFDGDAELAKTLASSIDSMYKNGSISTDGQGNIAGSSGTGTIS